MLTVLLLAIIVYLLWTVFFLLYEQGKDREERKTETHTKGTSESDILGKSRFKRSHSKPQATTYPKADAEREKPSTFADGIAPKEESSALSEIEDVPLTYEAEFLNLEEEEEEACQVSGETAVSATGIDFERVWEALEVITRHAQTEEQRSRSAETLNLMEGTPLMEQLRSTPERSAKIDHIVNARFGELYTGNESRERNSRKNEKYNS